mgnify:CR=1 FL=1
MEWLTWGNGAYLIAIVIGGVATLVATKYRPAVKEKQELAKECMDVVSAVLKLFIWKF